MAVSVRGLASAALAVAWMAVPAAAGAQDGQPAHRAHPELRLVGLMHENLAAVNRIVEAVTREDFARIPEEARHLQATARQLRSADLAALGLDAKRDTRFDAYLDAQASAAGAVAAAAREGSAKGVLLGVAQLYDRACIACHGDFRRGATLREPSVLLMRRFLGSVEGIHRGVALEDFSLVAREARQIEALADILAWSQVSDALFGSRPEAERTAFRRYLEQLSSSAMRIEGAAVERDAPRIIRTTEEMLGEGCVACHARFRKEKK